MNQPLASAADAIARHFREQGWALLEPVIDSGMADRLKQRLHEGIREEARLKPPGGPHDPDQLACCPYYGSEFLELLTIESILQPVNALLGETCTLYGYSNSSLPPHKGNFSSRPHVDRHYSTGDYLEGIAVMILLDDFTADNGATWFVPGSHHWETLPDDRRFESMASRLLAPRGSAFFFHPRLWHAGGINHTDSYRDAVVMSFCRAHIKQRLDLPRLLQGRVPADCSHAVLQKLGFFAAPPSSLADFYAVGDGSRDLRVRQTS